MRPKKSHQTCQLLEMKIVDANGVAFEAEHSLILILQEFHGRQPRARQGEQDRIAPDLPRMRQTDVRFQIYSKSTTQSHSPCITLQV